MNWNDASLFWLFPAVFAAGFIDSIAGGGGLITVPAYLLAGLPPSMVLGTNKFVSSVGTLVSVIRYIRRGHLLWKAAWIGIPCTLIGSMWGAHWVAGLNPEIVRKLILILLPIAALVVLIPRPRHPDATEFPTSRRLWMTVPLIGIFLGWYDGFFGPGTGTLLMIAFYGLSHLSFLQSGALARVINLTSNLGALAAFVWHGQVMFRWALPLCVAGIAGNYLGSHFAFRKGAKFVRAMLAVSVSLLILSLLWGR